MIIRRLSYFEWDTLKQSGETGYQALECQPYGAREDQFYIVAFTSELFRGNPSLGVEVADKGRTSGLFQNKGATGVLHPETARLILRPQAAEIVEKQPNGRIDIEGETWAEILTNIGEIAKIDFSDFTNAQSKPSAKSNKTKKKS